MKQSTQRFSFLLEGGLLSLYIYKRKIITRVHHPGTAINNGADSVSFSIYIHQPLNQGQSKIVSVLADKLILLAVVVPCTVRHFSQAPSLTPQHFVFRCGDAMRCSFLLVLILVLSLLERSIWEYKRSALLSPICIFFIPFPPRSDGRSTAHRFSLPSLSILFASWHLSPLSGFSDDWGAWIIVVCPSQASRYERENTSSSVGSWRTTFFSWASHFQLRFVQRSKRS